MTLLESSGLWTLGAVPPHRWHRARTRLGGRESPSAVNLEIWTRLQPCGIRTNDAIAWAHEIIERYESDGTPPTTLTTSRESPWRWRDSNRGSRFSKSARQRYRLESTCHLAETERYSLARTGNRWFVPPVSYSCLTEEGLFGPSRVPHTGTMGALGEHPGA